MFLVEKRIKTLVFLLKYDNFNGNSSAMRKFAPLFFLLFVQLLIGQDAIDKKWQIYVRAPSQKYQPIQDKNSPRIFLVRFNEPIKRVDLEKNRIELLRLLDPYHAIVSIGSDVGKKSIGTTAVPANNRWKLSEKLLSGTLRGKVPFVVRSSDPLRTRMLLDTLPGITFIRQVKNDIYFTGKLSIFESQLLGQPEVHYLGQESMTPVQESIVLDLNPAINNINNMYRQYPQIDGSGINISIKDNKFRETDIDLLNKLITSPLASELEDDHATDMATIIAGLGNSSIKGKGIAHAAKLQTSDFLNLSPDSESNLSNADVFIQNHSYGTISENFYGSLAAAYDAHITDHPEELHIFSSGNAGEEVPTDGPYADIGAYSNLTGNFKMAKNTLLVGAMDEEKQVLAFSSRGPTYDGRIKPELIGYSITGTSNATALTSGVAALLLQSHREANETNATAALLKALLINTADDVDSKGPDHRSGYGSMNAFKAMESLNNNQFITETIAQAQTRSFAVSIPPNAKNFKATLVWTDPPAEINSNRALVNDLDLQVIDAANGSYLPWILDTTPNSSALESAAQQGIDRLNNVEQVLIENPSEGELLLQVNGFDIPSGPQEFSIAYHWDINDSFRWNYPLAGDNFPYDGETASYFRWESSFRQETGTLSISYDLGETWELITESASLTDGFYLWPPPEDSTGTGILKMGIEGTEFLSEPFTISQTSVVKTSLDCEDTIELNWNPQEGVEEYAVYNLEDANMQRIAITADTTFVTSKSTMTSPYFAVEPLLKNGSPSVRGETIDYRTFNAGCYEAVVIATPSEDQQGGLLSISLSSIHEVAFVVVERKNGTAFTAVGELTDINSLSPTFLDTQPEQGLNQYRVRVVLNDGRSYTSEETDLVFLSSTPFITLPNPIDNGITVYTADFSDQEVQLEIFSVDGKRIFKKTITEEQEFVLLETLRPGLYALRLSASGGAELSKLVYKR